MQRFLILSVFSIINVTSFGQGVEVTSSLNTSSNILFQGAYGYGINFQFKPIDSLIQFGVAFQNSFKTTQYETAAFIGDPPTLFSIDHITSKTVRTSFRFNVLLVLRENKYVFWTIGADISYNILKGINDVENLYPSLTPPYQYDFNTVYAWGAAVLTKIEIRNIFTPKLSLCFNIRPEFIYGGTNHSGAEIIGPSFLGFSRFTEFQLGLKYNFNKKNKLL